MIAMALNLTRTAGLTKRLAGLGIVGALFGLIVGVEVSDRERLDLSRMPAGAPSAADIPLLLPVPAEPAPSDDSRHLVLEADEDPDAESFVSRTTPGPRRLVLSEPSLSRDPELFRQHRRPRAPLYLRHCSRLL